MTERIVAIDIGGTHARFAIAAIAAGRVVSLGEAVTLRTADHAGLEAAWQAFARRLAEPPPRSAAIAVAAPTQGDVLRFTNNRWTIGRDRIGADLGLDHCLLLNDFEAIGHAVGEAEESWFEPLAGPDIPLPARGTISVIGPGTGLGAAYLWRDGDACRVQEAQGGHIGFAPCDAVEDAILAHLRQRYGRVSVERVVAGPAIVGIYEVLAALDGRAVPPLDDHALWARALGAEDDLAVAAADRFCAMLGSVAGDLALAHGAGGVVVAGGLGLRIRDRLVRSDFSGRFVDKGRFAGIMAAIPVKLITHPQPGLFGAAAAFARRHAGDSRR
ncbi:glucokinase [Sphingopyxis granuli]|uniref:glucokinase n=1 Tax=Sphingopyxis granuli TaxID=267128 RepID=UPI001F52C90B|nr:glucokinase [Sphingopyxis granuli]UNK77904.1 glucokinase [Sphingopyxis granuli]